MSEKTKIFSPKLFLASKELTINIDKPMTIGRSEGDVIIEEDELLSGLHCQISPLMLELYIKDLGSSNGVFVNKQKIYPHADVKLSAGDEVKIGSYTFTFFDDEKELKKAFPPADRRKHPRPKNLYAPINFLNFYSSPTSWKALYLFAILLTMRSFIGNAHLEAALPENLQILSRLYHEQIIVSGLKITFWVWALSILHSYLMALYFNRNTLRKVIGVAAYSLTLAATVDFIDGPLWNLKSYVENRQAVLSDKFSDKPILRMKRIVDYQYKLTQSYQKTLKQLDPEAQSALNKDFKSLENRLYVKTLNVNDKTKISEGPTFE